MPDAVRELLARVSERFVRPRLDPEEADLALRESEERLRLALSAGKFGDWQLGLPDGEFIASAQCKANFGRGPDEPFTPEMFRAAVHPDDWERVEAAVQHAVATLGEYEADYRCIWPDGSIHWINARARTFGDREGRPLRMVGVTLDITDRIRAEHALRDADRRKDEFLATLAHELRNPLAPLRSGLELIHLAQDDDEAVNQAREMMERQLRQMVRLIDDLLDVSRISRGKVTLRKEPVLLADVVQSSVEATKASIEQAGVTLAVQLPDEPIPLHADAARLAQVFSNLLSNAAKFTRKGGHVWLRAERDGDEAVVSVRDDGVGIPPDMLDEVFEMFTQVHSSPERSQGGLGIGLSLVKRLVEKHGGRVEARSAGQGTGSEFIVRLPVGDAPVVEAPPAEPARPRRRPVHRRVLVVDDNRDAATSLAMVLEVTGNETRTAHDGIEAVEAANAFRPDVILLDIGMPRLNGYEAAKRIRAQPWGQDMVLVALTGWGSQDDRRRSEEAGFDFHLVKPVEPATLKALLDGLGAPRH